MTYEGLGEMFEGDFTDMCADQFCWCKWGVERCVVLQESFDHCPRMQEGIKRITVCCILWC